MTHVWGDSPAVLSAAEDGNTGAVLRFARRAKGETQRQTGDACGYSQSEISRIENGRTGIHDIRTLGRLARHFDIPPELLGLATGDDGVESLRRRDFLRDAAIGMAGAMLARDRLGAPGLTPPPVPHKLLIERIQRAHAAYQLGYYEAVSKQIPGVIADTTRALGDTDDEQSRRRLLEAQGWAFVLAAKLASKFELAPTARVAAERAVTAASYASSPVLQGAATSQLAGAFAESGEIAHSEEVAVIGADHLAIPGSNDPAVTSVRGALLLTAAMSTSAGGNLAATEQYLRSAEQLAAQLGKDGNLGWTGFGPTNVATHALAAAGRLDRPDVALRIADRIDVDRFPAGLVGRRCQVHLDAAQAHFRQRQHAEAVDRLLRAERIGPQVLRSNRRARRLIDDLLKRQRRPVTPDLGSLVRYASAANP
jgi:transcriptional regulator with XRE-family HTH domain